MKKSSTVILKSKSKFKKSNETGELTSSRGISFSDTLGIGLMETFYVEHLYYSPSSLIFLKSEKSQEESKSEGFLTYANIWPSLSSFFQPDLNILIVGCGKSSFSSELYDDGFEHLVNVDSLDIIEEMLERNQTRQKMKWMEWDGCELPFNDSSFDVVLDRGSMEALVANEGSVWDPDEIIISAVDRLSCEFSRVLTTGGIFLQVSFSQPHFRTKYFMGQHVDQTNTNPYAMTQGYCQSYNWTLSVTKLQLQLVDSFQLTRVLGRREETPDKHFMYSKFVSADAFSCFSYGFVLR